MLVTISHAFPPFPIFISILLHFSLSQAVNSQLYAQEPGSTTPWCFHSATATAAPAAPAANTFPPAATIAPPAATTAPPAATTAPPAATTAPPAATTAPPAAASRQMSKNSKTHQQ